MEELRCPHCGQMFTVDESGYADIARQVRDAEFDRELKRREGEMESRRAGELRELRLEQEKAAAEEKQASALALAERDRRIEQLTARLDAQQTAAETERRLAVSEALRERDTLLSEKEQKIVRLTSTLEGDRNEAQLKENNLRARYEEQLKLKDEQISYYKDFKARQSTKMVGESLEVHCMNEFNRWRMSAFPHAYFEKDNDARNGSKGDFIYREDDGEGGELLSIMFEMKNEMDGTATKHKNEDFFRELDKDRREKGCEYAVLVSLLEIDSEFYNGGIVDVSYRYDKMYVIRPQFFLPLITLLRNAARKSLSYRQELAEFRNRQIDLSHFEENLQAFKDNFGRNYQLASNKFQTAIEEIDKTVAHLQKTKEALLSSENHLRIANQKADDLTVRRLTKNAPSIREQIEKSRDEKDAKE